jgi:hypothetical protein
VSALQKAAHSIQTAILAMICAAALAAFLLTPAIAQTYYSIYGGARNTPPAPYRDARSSNPFSEFFGALFGARPRYAPDEEEEEKKRKSDAFSSVCVRTCDGKFFPISRGGRKDVSLDKVCHAMCPAAQTKVFSGLGIDNAVANDGQKYSALPNAFLYRTQIVEGCTCNGRDPYGVAAVDFENDPTLQGGDIVVQPKGFAVYRGGDKFIPIERAGMSPALVKQLMAIKILPPNPHAPHAVTVTIRPTPDTPEFLQKTSPDAAVPNANAPAANQPPARAN